VQQNCVGEDLRRVSVQNASKKSESEALEPLARKAALPAKRAKLPVLLVTRDDQLWPQVGGNFGPDLVLKQVDTIDELISTTTSGQPAIVLMDARGQPDAAAALSRLQLHSPRFAVIALDEVGSGHTWTGAIALRQVVAQVAVPIQTDKLAQAVENAHEEVKARVALLGESGTETAGGTAAPFGTRKIPWIPLAIAVAVAAGAATFFAMRHSNVPVAATPAAVPQAAPQAAGKPAAVADEKIDLLIEKAQQAMTERHFIDPADGSALTLYRNALLLDPNNGEARQGLQRLAEILFARVQSALDERKFDVALQSLETARSINPGDSRLSALDERIAALRAELGPAQILAAINAQNFDRAAQLIDEAARSKSLSNSKLAQLREELRRKREESDVSNLVKLIDTRLQQDKLLEPRNDSAAFYLTQARAAGASAASLQVQSQEIYKRLAQLVHADIDQRRYADADRLLTDMHGFGYSAAATASLQHDLNTARAAQSVAVPEQPQFLDLAQARLAQGKLTEPDNDCALFYVTQLAKVDPKNSALPRISAAVQQQILEQARAAIDTGQLGRAEVLLQMAGTLGSTPDLNTLNVRLAQIKSGATPEVQEAALTRTRQIELDYPGVALRKNIEGWVDLSYTVTAEGKVTKVKVLNSSPSGVFDTAAANALTRLRYKPMMQAGKPVAVNTKLRIAFHLEK
jgi:TonB family protein